MIEYTIRITDDPDCESPRVDGCNAEHFCFSHRRYKLCDEGEEFDVGDYAGWDELSDFLLKERGAVVMFTVSMTDHSALHLYTGEPRDRWDAGVIGFAYFTAADIENVIPSYKYPEDRIVRKDIIEKLLKIVDEDLDIFSNWLNGYCKGYAIENPSGEIVASCAGFYTEEAAMAAAKEEVEYLKQHDADYPSPDLPLEFKDEDQKEIAE